MEDTLLLRLLISLQRFFN